MLRLVEIPGGVRTDPVLGQAGGLSPYAVGKNSGSTSQRRRNLRFNRAIFDLGNGAKERRVDLEMMNRGIV
jgi:hypothetical protein